jgi:hypothetical protein
MIQAISAIQFTGDNDDDIDTWLPVGITTSRFVSLLIVSIPLIPEQLGIPGEVKRGEWIILQVDGKLRRVTDSFYKATWRKRINEYNTKPVARDPEWKGNRTTW